MSQDGLEAGIPVVSFRQSDTDIAFLDFEGAVAADCSKIISTGNGTGSLNGPKTRVGEDVIGWDFARMIKIRIKDGDEWLDCWIPAFTCDPRP